MRPRLAAIMTSVALVGACGSSRSQYARQTAAPGELVWRFDDRLQVTRDGQVVAEAGGWDHLAAAVSCVPRAKDWATAATARHGKGTATLWAGWIVGLVSVATGAVVALSDTDNDSRVLGGLALMSGGLIVGGGIAVTGNYLRASADARGIDAVNLYNDELAAAVRCVR